jgi:AcrR family transcriptional regulator
MPPYLTAMLCCGVATKRSSNSGSPAPQKPSADFRAEILSAFAAQWSEEGRPPRSVPRFCKALGTTEAEFYRHFPSLHAVEKAFWGDWTAGTIAAVAQGGDWEGFSARERYLAFLFAVVQSAAERRSLLLERFHGMLPVSNPGELDGLRMNFLAFARQLVDRGVETGEIADRRGITPLYPGILYIHLRWVLDHYIKDESEGFERTDAFIEKTVALAFDLFRSQAIDSAADLARFLLPGNPWNWCSGGGK